MAARRALAPVVLGTMAVAAAYGSAFLPGGAPGWAPWSMVVGIALMFTGSMALGATKWQTIRKVVLPSAIAPLTTGVVLIAGRIFGPLIERLPQNNPPPARPNRDATAGAVVPVAGGMQVIHTPGHTMGHVSYLMPGHGGVLFAGDAAGYVFGRLGKPVLIFTEDMVAAKESIRKLAALEFDTACFGHGGVLKGKASVEFRRYVERRARAAG